MAITLSTIRTSAWDTIRNFLKTGTYSITNSDKIYGSFNDQLVKKVGYPLVIIAQPTVSITKVRFGMTTKRVAVITQEINLYYLSQRESKAAADEITGNIISGMGTLSGQGLKRIQFEDDDTDVVPKKYSPSSSQVKVIAVVG